MPRHVHSFQRLQEPCALLLTFSVAETKRKDITGHNFKTDLQNKLVDFEVIYFLFRQSIFGHILHGKMSWMHPGYKLLQTLLILTLKTNNVNSNNKKIIT